MDYIERDKREALQGFRDSLDRRIDRAVAALREGAIELGCAELEAIEKSIRRTREAVAETISDGLHGAN